MLAKSHTEYEKNKDKKEKEALEKRELGIQQKAKHLAEWNFKMKFSEILDIIHALKISKPHDKSYEKLVDILDIISVLPKK